MRRVGLLLVAAALFALWIYPVLGKEQTIGKVSIEDILKGMKYNESLIRDLKVKYKIRSQPWGRTPYEQSKLWMMKGKKEYIERQNEEDGKLTYHDKVAFDGEISTTWNFINNGGLILGRRHTALDSTGPKRLLGSTIFKDRSLLELVEVEHWEAKLLDETEEINGSICHVILVRDKPGGFEIKAWIDTQRGFKPLKLEVHIVGSLSSRTYPIELQRFEGDIWYPVRGIMHAYEIKNPERVGVHEVIVEELEVNSGLDDEIFTLKYEKGTGIWDDIHKVGYVVSEDLAPDYEQLRQLAAVAKPEVARAEKCRSCGPGASRRNALLITLVVLAGGAAAIFFFLKKSRAS